MGFSDRLRAWFKGQGKRSSPSKSTESASRSSTKELSDFVRSRDGVEAYLEPKTAVYSTTLLLVAADGEYLRRPIKDRSHAAEFCGRHNIPLYDAAKVGYPRRMRDYEQGRSTRKVDLSELPPWPGDDVITPDVAGPPPPPTNEPGPTELRDDPEPDPGSRDTDAASGDRSTTDPPPRRQERRQPGRGHLPSDDDPGGRSG